MHIVLVKMVAKREISVRVASRSTSPLSIRDLCVLEECLCLLRRQCRSLSRHQEHFFHYLLSSCVSLTKQLTLTQSQSSILDPTSRILNLHRLRPPFRPMSIPVTIQIEAFLLHPVPHSPEPVFLLATLRTDSITNYLLLRSTSVRSACFV